MPIRVIAGSAKGRRLKMVSGDSTRPVMDRVKEACFNIIGRDVVGARFLDLYAGTGSVGIEALSRGARLATFIERDRNAIETIRRNLEITKLGDRAVVRRADVLSALAHPPETEYDIIYIAPPQYKDLWQKTLALMDSSEAWGRSGVRVIIQIDPSEEKPITLSHFMESDRRVYGKTLLWFFEGHGRQSEE